MSLALSLTAEQSAALDAARAVEAELAQARAAKFEELGKLASEAGTLAFDFMSRADRIAALIKELYRGPDDYAPIRNAIHRPFAVYFMRRDNEALTEADAAAELSAPTKSDAAKKADAKATDAFNTAWKKTAIPNPKARAPRASKANEDKPAETPNADAPQGDKPSPEQATAQGDASQPTLSQHAAKIDIANALARLSIAEMFATITSAAQAKLHNPGKSWSQFDLDCVKELENVAAFWQAGEKAENAKDVTPPAEPAKAEPAEPAKAPRKRGNKAA